MLPRESFRVVSNHVYDDKGERIMKSSVIQSNVYVNDQIVNTIQDLEPYTLYVNPYFVITEFSNADKVSKAWTCDHLIMSHEHLKYCFSREYTENIGLMELHVIPNACSEYSEQKIQANGRPYRTIIHSTWSGSSIRFTFDLFSRMSTRKSPDA